MSTERIPFAPGGSISGILIEASRCVSVPCWDVSVNDQEWKTNRAHYESRRNRQSRTPLVVAAYLNRATVEPHRISTQCVDTLIRQGCAASSGKQHRPPSLI